MPSPTEKPNAANATASPREMIEQAMAATIMEVIQLRRTLWLVVKQAGAPLVVNEAEAHPLWRMKALRLPDGKMQLEALQLLEPTEEQLDALAEVLNGAKTELGDAMDQTELKDHPPAYVQMRLQSRVVRKDDGYWIDARLAKINERPATENN